MAFDLTVFNKQTYTAMTETVAQQTNLFNQASAGAITLAPADNQGDFSIEASFKAISGLVRRRDAYGTGDITAKALEMLSNASVKVAAGTPPVAFQPQQYAWIKQNSALAALKIGEQLAKAQMADMVNAAVRAAAAATTGNASVLYDGTAAAASFSALNAAAAKFGDRMMDIKAWVVHSKVMADLFNNALTNGQNLFNYENVNVIRDPFGRLFIVTDSAPLFISGPPDKYLTLGLVEGGVAVQTNGDFNAVMVDTTGKENIITTYQAEWTYNVGVKGYTWDTTNGGKSPTDAALGTSTNWDKTASDNKDTAGVVLKSL
jgi:hypothetical protein